MTEQNTRLGIWLMVLTTFIFAVQDGISRHLAGEYNVLMVVMIRYWFFAAFVISVAARQGRRAARRRRHVATADAGVSRAASDHRDLRDDPWLYPAGAGRKPCGLCLLPAADRRAVGAGSGRACRLAPVGRDRVGFVGVIIILEPGFGVFQPQAVVPFLAALMFALYGLLTRYVARRDSAATSFFWTGTVGSVGMTAVGVWFWEPMTGPDWAWMGALCVTGAAGHFTLIKCYEVAEASAVQPFAYLQLLFASTLGILVFSETIRLNVALGAALIVGAGLFTLWRQRQAA